MKRELVVRILRDLPLTLESVKSIINEMTLGTWRKVTCMKECVT